VSRDQLVEGFLRLVLVLDDLALDTPDAVDILAKFTARAVVDECLPPAFPSVIPRDFNLTDRCARYVAVVRTHLDGSFVAQRMATVWGAGLAASVDDLKAAITNLLQDLFVTQLLDEAVAAFKSLQCAHFGHELVRRAVLIALDKTPPQLDVACALIRRGVEMNAFGRAEVAKGVARLVAAREDVLLDFPSFDAALGGVVAQLSADGVLPQE
jgi:programmed cell death protein 4